MLRYVTRTLFLAFTLTALAPASAQPFVIDEAVSGGGLNADTGDGVALADDGSRYVVGTFEGTATFGDVSVTSAGDSDIFLVKYDADLNAVWARRAGTDVFNDFGESVAVGPDGSVYATGFFTGIATWDGGANPNVELTTFSDFDAFVVKYTPSGDLEWVRQAGGTGQDTGRDVAVDAAGNVYLVGGFEGVGTFGDVSLTSAGSSDVFLVKYDADGTVVWARRGGSDQGDLAYGVAVTDDGSAHVSGSFRGVAQFGPLPIQSAGATDVFVVQYDTDGEPVWLEGIGADGSEFTRGGGIGLDTNADVYVQGSFSNTILVASDVLESTGFTDIFVAKLSAGGEEVWGRRGGGDGTNFSAALAVDASGNVLATGYIDGTGTFADEPITTQGRDGYLAVLDGAGDLVTFELLGGTGQDAGTGVAANDARASFAATGSFRGTATFGEFDLTSAGSSDVFVIGGSTAGAPVPPTLFVDADATGAETGLSWADAFTDLQDALATADTLDADSLAIWVAEGTYYPTDDADRGVSFVLPSGLGLYGGFSGTETNLDQSDPTSNETVLSGNLGNPNSYFDNSYHVVVAAGTNAFTILDGFTVRDGYASGEDEDLNGAGVYIGDGDLTITRCFITDNRATAFEDRDGYGGGVLCSGGAPMFLDVVFQGNEGPFGGAVANLNGCTPTFESTTFSFNATNFTIFVGAGGALYNENSTVAIATSAFESNFALEGGAVYNLISEVQVDESLFLANNAVLRGGAWMDQLSTSALRSVTFRGNMTGGGASVRALGGGAYIGTNSMTDFVYTQFVRNAARGKGTDSAEGGGLYVQDARVRLVNAQFLGNSVQNFDSGDFGLGDVAGGGLRAFNPTALTIANALFVGNQVSGPASAQGGALSITGGQAYVVNTDVLSNGTDGDEPSGSGFYFDTDGTVRNGIIWNNTPSSTPVAEGQNSTFQHTIVQGGCPAEAVCEAVLNANPRFDLDPTPGNDGMWGTEDDNYGSLHLQAESPAVNSGRDTYLIDDLFDLDGDGDTEEPLPLDIDGSPRVQGNAVDLGAYESPFAVALEPGAGVPTINALGAAYPNPFHDRTTLALDVAEAQDVTVQMFDLLGRRVGTVHDGPLDVGQHRLVIEASRLPAGVYVVRAEGEAFQFVQRVTLVR